MNEDKQTDLIPDDDKIGFKFGAEGEIRFLNPVCAKLYNSVGEEVLCKCGNNATTTLIGKDLFIATCSDCLTPDCL